VETKSGKPTLLIYKLIERMVRFGIPSSFMGRNEMVADYSTMKKTKIRRFLILILYQI